MSLKKAFSPQYLKFCFLRSQLSKFLLPSCIFHPNHIIIREKGKEIPFIADLQHGSTKWDLGVRTSVDFPIARIALNMDNKPISAQFLYQKPLKIRFLWLPSPSEWTQGTGVPKSQLSHPKNGNFWCKSFQGWFLFHPNQDFSNPESGNVSATVFLPGKSRFGEAFPRSNFIFRNSVR